MSQGDAELNGLAHLQGDLARQVLELLVGAGGLVGGLALLVVFLLVALVIAVSTPLNGSADGIPRLDPASGSGRPPALRNAIPPAQLPPMQANSALGLVPGWAAQPALNQYACGNYRSVADCRTWSAAACSAAALDWLLGAYGVRLGGIDDAIGLIGPGSGISTQVGLLDRSGARLAAAEAVVGLKPRRGRPRSSGDLRAWLSRGPLLLDGDAWFGVGHWFVAIGSDAGGVFTRDSSGHDTRYLSWARLYGEVGWGGWAVGVAAVEGGTSA